MSNSELYLISLSTRTELSKLLKDYVRTESAKVEESLWLPTRIDFIVEVVIQL